MPNNITNRIKATNDDLTQFISNGKGYKFFDFSKIVPCPQNLKTMGDVNCDVNSWAEIALGLIDFNPTNVFEKIENAILIEKLQSGKGVGSFSNEDFELFVAYLRNYRETGTVTNLDWNRKYWGTKWNSYGTEILSENEVKFQTAWTPPHPVIEVLATILNTDITHEWADEDTGHNVGRRIYSSHSFLEEILDKTKEGYELAFSLDPDIVKYYKLEDGKYVYKD